MTQRDNQHVKNLTIIAICSALVVALQFFSSNISNPFGVNFTLALTPIILCGALTGLKGGIVTGMSFGAITVINAVISRDIWTAALLQLNSKTCVFTILICFIKAIAAGLVSALIYNALKKKNRFLAIILASAAAPIVNTALFILLALTVLSSSFAELAASGNALFAGSDKDIIYYLVIGCAGINFLVEFAVNLILAPAIHRVIKAVGKGSFN